MASANPIDLCLDVAHDPRVGLQAGGNFVVGHPRCQQQADLLALVEAGVFEDLVGGHLAFLFLRVSLL